MRIIQLVDSLAPGGAERVVLMLASGLVTRGHDVTLVVSEPGGVLEPQLKGTGVDYRIMEHSAPLGLDAMVLLRRMVKELRPDVLHCHLLGSDIVGRVAGLTSRVPVVVSTAHDRYPRGWKYDGFRRITGRLIEGTIACSADVEEYCRTHLRIPEKRLFRVDNGVDVDAFAESRRLFDRVRSFAIVASHIPRKGHRYLFEAMRDLVPEYPEMRLLVVGTGPLEDELRAMAAAMSLSGVIEFLGARADVPRILAEVEAVVLPSLDEGLPIAVIEAMAARKVVIATSVSAVPEVLAGGGAGVLVPPGDVPALARALRQVMDDPAPLRLANAAFERVQSHYSAASMVEGYLRIYAKLGVYDR